MPFILGTAGHIDHGKTSLVQALTGINCDRLEEERRRGITIELGFAWMDLPDGQRLGIIDVPGHERFVRNMVAGAAGIDLVMLVIAADEGVMPQTREHLDICSLLGIRRGFVVLTKCDMVEEDWIEFVKADTAAFLEGSFLEGCPILPVSSVTGQGLDAVRAHIAREVHALQPARGTDIFRLPVDRVFSLKGFGTIVTGTVISGHINVNEDAVVMPAGHATHIRSLQRHEQPTEAAEHGERCAANLQGLDVSDISRGSVLARPGTLLPSERWIVRLTCLADQPLAVRSRTEMHFHHGSLETLARACLFDRPKLAPGETALAEIRFTSPLAAVFGDHCVLRAGSPLRAVAGGVIVSPLPPQFRAKDPARSARLALLDRLPDLAAARTPENDAALTSGALSLRGPEGADLAVLRVLTGLPKKRLDKALQQLSAQKKALCCDREVQLWVDADTFAALCAGALLRASDLQAKDPLMAGFARAALATGWARGVPVKVTGRVFDSLIAEGRLNAAGELLGLSGQSVTLSNRQQQLADALVDAHVRGGLTPPNLKDVLADLRVSDKEAAPVVRVLATDGDLVRVRDGMYYARDAFQEILNRVAAWFDGHDNLDVTDMKELFGLSRKYNIALLEYLDQARYTVRIGDKRQFRPASAPPGSSASQYKE